MLEFHLWLQGRHTLWWRSFALPCFQFPPFQWGEKGLQHTGFFSLFLLLSEICSREVDTYLNSKYDVKFAILINLFMNSWEAVHRLPGSAETQVAKHWEKISIGGAKEALSCNSSDSMVIRVMVVTALWHRCRNHAYFCSISSGRKSHLVTRWQLSQPC